jgi:hypothetical protein
MKTQTNPIEHHGLQIGTLARRAHIPVGRDTTGWEWLLDLRDETINHIETWTGAPIHDVLKDVVLSSITTSRPDKVWTTFVDVEAWKEDPNFWGIDIPNPEDGGLTALALQLLHLIGFRFAEAVAEQACPDRVADDGGVIYLSPLQEVR